MRSPLAALLTGVRTVRNQAPVPFSSQRRSNLSYAYGAADEVSAMNAMSGNGTLFAIVDRLANATASVEWKLWRSAASGKPEDREQITRHAALTLWNKPNPFMPRQEFVETFQQHLDLTGEADWITGTVPGLNFPTELWPVRPDKITPVPDAEKFLAGYIYRGPDGEKVPLETSQVIQLRRPNPLDPYRGLGPVQAILIDLDSARYGAEWNRNFFLNSAEPGGIIQLDKNLSDTAFAQLRDRWNEQHRGVAQAHRVAILEQGQWIDRKFTQRDMQFAELYQLSDEKIRQAFGYPKPMLGSVDNVNRANAEAGEYVFAKWLIVPRLERIKGALNHDLLPLFGPTGQGLEFDYVSPVPADEVADNAALTAKTTAYATLTSAGVTPEDAAAVVGLPAMRTRPMEALA